MVVSGYDSLLSIIATGNDWEKDELNTLGEKYVVIDSIKNTMKLMQGGEVLEETTVNEISEKLLLLSGGERYKEYSQENLIFDIEGEKYDYRILLEGADILNPSFDKSLMSNEVQIQGNSEGKVLIREK